MDSAVKMLRGGDRCGVRHKLNARPYYYAIESEASDRVTYVYYKGEFALCYGRLTMMLREDITMELRDVLNDILGGAS